MRQCYEFYLHAILERVLREDKTHSTGLTMSDPDILVPNEPSWHKVKGKTLNILEKLKITSGKSTLF